ncbi:Zinc finger CCCH domain-containing protein 65 [Glycine soja]|uniref:Zinc finger CCCH domain-containing protein 65 n=1 Tax=Glycine soja TaxID=3848 RepID=A0A445FQZ5_GLYSO|nr:Zinc finger CCCH domain-containing protein 65 [Glycine soja]
MDSSKASELAMYFPPYRRSQLRSNTYRALVHLLSHLQRFNSSLNSTPHHSRGRMDQENPEKEPKCYEVVHSDCLDPKDPICLKDIQEVQEIIEGVGDKDVDFTTNKMVLDDIEHMMGMEDMSTQANGFDKEQELMNEFEQVMKGTEDLICDSEFIPLNLGLDNTQCDGGEVGLMDYQAEMEEGELSGDLGIDGNSFDVASANALILQQMEVDEVQEPENVTGNMIYPSKIEIQEKLDNASKKNKCGGNKGKKKKANRKKRAEKNKQLGVKRLQLKHVQRPKVVSHCRHYLNGRCHEGDKCQFSHDVVPLTKSKPCTHFARQSCMKGDDCPFDHQLSKYPCTNFVSKGPCYRGDACLFSHQVSTKEDIPTPSNMCRPELSPLLSGNANSSAPLNNNHGSSSVKQNHLTNSAGIHSCTSVEHKVTNTVLKQPTPPKGISFINLAKLSPSLSSLKQGTVTTKESPVQIGTREDQSVFHKTQNKVDIPKKLPTVTPKGINFLSFGKGSVCSFKSVNRDNGIKLPQLFNFGLPEQAKSSLNKDDYNKASDRTKQNAPQTDIFLTEILGKNQSVAEEMKSKLPEKTSVDVFMRDYSHSKSVQEGIKSSDNSQSSKGQKAFLSTLAFAAEHESDIKMKYPIGGLPI